MQKIAKEALFDLYIVKDWTQRRIAEHFGCKQADIKHLLRVYKIRKESRGRPERKRPWRRRAWTLATYIMVFEDLAKGIPIAEIAEFYNRNEEEIRNNVQKALSTGMVKHIPKAYQYLRSSVL